MKKLNLKTLIVGGILTMGLVAFGDINDYVIKPPDFQKENKSIQKDLTAIRSDRTDISSLKSELKSDRKANRTSQVIADKTEMKKIKADLKRNKTYLAADRKELKCSYNLAINQHKDAVKTDRKELCSSKKELKKDLSKGNTAELQNDAVVVSQKTEKLQASEYALEGMQQRSSDNYALIRSDVHENVYASTKVKDEKTWWDQTVDRVTDVVSR